MVVASLTVSGGAVVSIQNNSVAHNQCALSDDFIDWLFGDDVDDEAFGSRLRSLYHRHPQFRERIDKLILDREHQRSPMTVS